MPIKLDVNILIDRNRLDDECAEAPGYFDFYIKEEADSEHEFKSHEATLDKRIRRMTPDQVYEDHGIKVSRGITEGIVDSILKSDKDYIKLRKSHLDAMANRKSMEKKIDMLKVMAQLHGQGYFSKIENSAPAKSEMALGIKKVIAENIDENFTKPRRDK